MIKTVYPLILASGSARQRELLSLIAPDYTVDVSDVDESCKGTPEEMVRELSRRKAGAVKPEHARALILGADTLVFCDEVLGKPHSTEEAAKMLRELSGKWHEVYTGVTLIDTNSGKTDTRCEMTRVHFRELSDVEILEYIATGEPMDKAGAYAIQGAGDAFIDRIEGSYSNVVGLPLAVVTKMLRPYTLEGMHAEL